MNKRISCNWQPASLPMCYLNGIAIFAIIAAAISLFVGWDEARTHFYYASFLSVSALYSRRVLRINERSPVLIKLEDEVVSLTVPAGIVLFSKRPREISIPLSQIDYDRSALLAPGFRSFFSGWLLTISSTTGEKIKASSSTYSLEELEAIWQEIKKRR